MHLLVWLLLLYQFYAIYGQYHYNKLRWRDENFLFNKLCLNMTRDILHDSHNKVASVYKIRQLNQVAAAYEVGYLTQSIHDTYRRMLDRYYSVVNMNITGFYTMELTLYLEDVERFYWVIEHVSNMLNEVERKYQVKSAIDESYEDPRLTTTTPPPTRPPPRDPYSYTKKPKMKFNMEKYLKYIEQISSTTVKRKGRYPREYGWDLETFNEYY